LSGLTNQTNKESMHNLESLRSGDAIAIKYGFDMLQARVIANNGTHIIWSSFRWLRSSARVSAYKEMEEMEWTYLGKEAPIWKFWSDVSYK